MKTFETFGQSINPGSIIRVEFTIWETFYDLKKDYDKLLDFLRNELIGKVVKFNGNQIKVIDIGHKKPLNTNSILLLGEDKVTYSVDNDVPIVYFKKEEDIQIDDISNDNDFNKVILVGVPSGEVFEVDRDTFRLIFDKKLLFFADNYTPTFYGFVDENVNKIKSIMNWKSIQDLMNDKKKR